jgi:hypothetical protein
MCGILQSCRESIGEAKKGVTHSLTGVGVSGSVVIKAAVVEDNETVDPGWFASSPASP